MIKVELDPIEVVNQCTGQSQWWDVASAIFVDRVDIASTIGKVGFMYTESEHGGT
jgi:hypothetical protein